VTFALLGRCPRTAQLGVAVATSDLAVGARVPHATAGVGVVVTQHRTDPRLGPRVLALLASGCTPREAIDGAVASTRHHAWRQLAVLDAAGAWAGWSGSLVTPLVAEHPGDGCLAVGNMLAGAGVAEAMVAAFAAGDDLPLAGRLLAGLRGGERAGGETGALRSAAVLVVEREAFPLVDLRIDASEDPIGDLAELWEQYAPWTRDFVRRALDPDGATGRPDPHPGDSRPRGPRSTTT
jgi:uncharacterized Ntn-hydrolase superfamily protein